MSLCVLCRRAFLHAWVTKKALPEGSAIPTNHDLYRDDKDGEILTGTTPGQITGHLAARFRTLGRKRA